MRVLTWIMSLTFECFSEGFLRGRQTGNKAMEKYSQNRNLIAFCHATRNVCFSSWKSSGWHITIQIVWGISKSIPGLFCMSDTYCPWPGLNYKRKNRPSVTSVMSDNTLLAEILWQKHWEFSNDIAIVTALQFWEISLFLRMIRHRHLSRLGLVDLR